MENNNVAIGIDLGTTNSCVGLYTDGKMKILENSEGERLTASCIFFDNLQKTIVGKHAQRMAMNKPENGIYEVKRLAGRKFNDPNVQNDLNFLSFKVKADMNGDSLIAVNTGKTTLEKTPQELCAIILQKLKKDAEEKLGQTISNVVITVPAYFNVTQREVTLSAAKEVGFTTLKLLNEPTAAALSYYFENRCQNDNYSIVYDFGGGTLDVAILKMSNNNIEIVGINGDTHLGGHDLDNLILDFVADKLIKDYKYNPKLDKTNLRRLRTKCEEAKKELSVTEETVITLNGFVLDNPCVQITITRKDFEEISAGLFQKSIKILDSCIENSDISKEDIKEVILTGGSSRIPKIQKMISEYFEGKALNKFVNPDECVAEGAALQAAMLSKHVSQKIENLQLRDVVPLSLGVESLCDKMNFLIKRNSHIPTTATISYVTSFNKQTGVSFRIYEGERSDVRKNRLLGTFEITGLKPAPPLQCKIKFFMEIDSSGILSVKASEALSNNSRELKINYIRGNQNEEDVRNTLLDAAEHQEEDKRFQNFAKIKRCLLNYCELVIYNMEEKQIQHHHKVLYERCLAVRSLALKAEMEQEDDLVEITSEIKTKCEPLVKSHQFKFMDTL